MTLRTLLPALAAVAAAAFAATAYAVQDGGSAPSAPVVLFSDDAESGPETKWNLTSDGGPIAGFEPSDSDTRKLRGNQRSGGARSFWAGIPLDRLDPVGIQSGTTSLTTKELISIPAEGAKLTYSSLFQNEGDDQGIVSVMVVGAKRPVEVDVIQAVNTAAGETDEAICQPADPDVLTRGLATRQADLSQFAGKEVLLSFSLVYGEENRVLSQPCGWYVDDVAVTTGG